MPDATLVTDKDAYVDQQNADTNFGTDTSLFVQSEEVLGDPQNRRTYCGFDLSGLPAEAEAIVSATLRLTPVDQTGGRALRCHEVTGAWTESGLTWNNQPAVGTDHGTESSSDVTHEWDVTATVQAAFPDGRVAFRIRDDAEGETLEALQEYGARESTNQEPELVVTYETSEAADLSSTVTPTQFSDTADLSATLTVQRSGQRFGQFARIELLDDGDPASPIGPQGMAYDADRDSLWVADFEAQAIYRYDRHTLTLEQAFDVSPLEPDGVAYDGADLWVSGSGTIKRFSIGANTLTEDASYDHSFRTSIAWDGATIWSVDFDFGDVYKHNLDATLSIAETFDLTGPLWGIDFTSDGSLWLLKDKDRSGEGDFWIQERDPTDLALVNEWAYPGDDSARPYGMAFAPGHAAGPLYVTEDTSGEVLYFPAHNLASTVQPGNIPTTTDVDAQVTARVARDADLAALVTPRVKASQDLPSVVTVQVATTAHLDSQVQPSAIGADADLASQVLVEVDGTAELDTQITVQRSANGELDASLTPQFSGTGDLDAQVKPNIGGESDLASQVTPEISDVAALTTGVTVQRSSTASIASTVEPTLFDVAARGRVLGAITSVLLVKEEDFGDISSEAGSSITWTQDGVEKSMRRILQLIPSGSGADFPREATSRAGQASSQDELRRGDAILYAVDGDVVRPGDTITWQGRTWEIVGGLGWEMVGDVRVYQEVGLRRLPITTAGRVKGAVA